MHLEIPHKTTKADALARVQQGLEQHRAQLLENAQIHEERWDGDTLHFDATAKGQRVSGTLTVDEKNFIIDAKLPLLMRPFEGMIERELASRVATLG